MSRTIPSWLLACLFCATFSGCAGSPEAAPTAAPVSATDVPVWLESNPNAVVVDVRTPEEFADGHIDGAKLIVWGAKGFEDRVQAELDPEQPVLLICRSANRSKLAADVMKNFGFRNLAELEGGMLAWNQAGLPVVKP
jgi:rhodanese-related sulfurtransferase